MHIDTASLTYTASKPTKDIETLRKHGLEPRASITAPTPITLSPEARAKAHIPDEATRFFWAFPVGGESFVGRSRAYFSITTASAAFFIYGGYVYLDSADKVVAVRAITVGSGLNFSPCQPLRSEYVSQHQRWCPVTIPFMRERGAVHFTWINPGEELQSNNGGAPWRVCEHGAFAYLFHEDINEKSDRDVFFEVSESSEMKMPLGRVGSNDD
eukprot:gnl/TRDRNA2_/TRDRNA2_127376_c0_seq1.p1 gnl/TRDRNA2_/TRDRNA2_127376_c0~~gnl/TRDRNA2_/TRDRNA2_127376_c0_seq1.p1  ORF type:complete len:213 (-),score=26.32 gnl/TRDRNA2_/TRDRNA2_127376_c0_seq1:151-789(-)